MLFIKLLRSDKQTNFLAPSPSKITMLQIENLERVMLKFEKGKISINK